MRLGKISQVAASFFQTASKTVKGAAYAPIKKANISNRSEKLQKTTDYLSTSEKAKILRDWELRQALPRDIVRIYARETGKTFKDNQGEFLNAIKDALVKKSDKTKKGFISFLKKIR